MQREMRLATVYSAYMAASSNGFCAPHGTRAGPARS
jgi:hypothetical protein